MLLLKVAGRLGSDCNMKLIQLLSYNLSWKIRPPLLSLELQTLPILHLGTKNKIKATEIILTTDPSLVDCGKLRAL